MKQLVLLIIAMLAILSCKHKECECYSSSEICVNGDCVLKPNYMWLGPAGQVVGGHNLYYGVLPPGFCTDTIALDLTLEDSQNPFWLYTKVAPWGVMYNNLDVLEKYSETEYLLTDNGSIFCRTPHNKQWYPTDIYCSITPDTVFLDFKLRERNDTIDRYVDSCKIAMPHI